MGELGDKLRAALSSSLAPGEELEGACVASQVGVFRGRQVAIGVTPGRLVVQDTDRRFAPKGEALSLPPEEIDSAQAEGAGGGWQTPTASIMEGAAVTLKLRTVGGEKMKLMLMRGTGLFGGLGGGEDQRQGVEALAAWFERHA